METNLFLRGENFVNAISAERDLKKYLEFLKLHHYTNVKMRISGCQKDKLKKAFESSSKSITIRLTFSHLHGEDVVVLTKPKLDRLLEAYEEKKGMKMRLSKMQLAHNMKIEGVFLPALAGLTPFITGTVLPALGVGAI